MWSILEMFHSYMTQGKRKRKAPHRNVTSVEWQCQQAMPGRAAGMTLDLSFQSPDLSRGTTIEGPLVGTTPLSSPPQGSSTLTLSSLYHHVKSHQTASHCSANDCDGAHPDLR